MLSNNSNHSPIQNHELPVHLDFLMLELFQVVGLECLLKCPVAVVGSFGTKFSRIKFNQNTS